MKTKSHIRAYERPGLRLVRGGQRKRVPRPSRVREKTAELSRDYISNIHSISLLTRDQEVTLATKMDQHRQEVTLQMCASPIGRKLLISGLDGPVPAELESILRLGESSPHATHRLLSLLERFNLEPILARALNTVSKLEQQFGRIDQEKSRCEQRTRMSTDQLLRTARQVGLSSSKTVGLARRLGLRKQ